MRKGRPRKRWKREVEEDVKPLKIKNWNQQAKEINQTKPWAY